MSQARRSDAEQGPRLAPDEKTHGWPLYGLTSSCLILYGRAWFESELSRRAIEAGDYYHSRTWHACTPDQARAAYAKRWFP